MRQFLCEVGHGWRVRLVAVLVVAGVAMLTAPTAGAGGQAGNSCPAGFDLGTLTVDQFLALPRIQAGIAATGGDPTPFIAFFDGTNKNGDDVICGKTVPAGNGSGAPKWQFEYNFVDDNSSATTG
jgi:hypothetical protein